MKTRKNNAQENIETLCKSCHQKEHDCHLAFGDRTGHIDKWRMGHHTMLWAFEIKVGDIKRGH
jgi:5-methylcytosine-specific restriction endonuclease McrA